MIKPKGRQYGTIGRICGNSSRRNALKDGARAADVNKALAYVKALTVALDALALPDLEQLAELLPDQAAPATATTTVARQVPP